MIVTVVSKIEALIPALEQHLRALPNITLRLVRAEDAAALEEATIVLADPALVAGKVLPACRWLQSTWAGVECLLTAQPPPTYAVTRTGGCMGPAMAEYVLAGILRHERHHARYAAAQAAATWKLPQESQAYRPLSTLTLGLLGLGDLGLCVANACRGMGMRVVAFTRSPRAAADDERAGISTHQSLAAVLDASDFVCNLLPSTPATHNLLTPALIRTHLSIRRAVFINVGRGDIVSEATLVEALTEGWLGGAVLDVFETEPLPVTSQLWRLPGVFITPHVAALSTPEAVASVFARNLCRFIAKEPLLFRVDFERGY